MNNTQYLVTASDNDTDKKTNGSVISKCISNNFRRCCSFFGVRWNDGQYENLDDHVVEGEQNKNKTSVNFFRLYRFADRLDLLLIVTGLCALIIYVFCSCANLILLSRLAGILTLPPSNKSDVFQQKNAITELHKSSNDSNQVTLLPSSDLTSATHQNKPVDLLYLLLIFGTLEIIFSSIQYFALIMTSKRQACRMRQRLFQSLIQRNISYFDENTINGVNIKVFDNIDRIERGMGFELALLLAVLFYIIMNVTVSFFLNYQLTLILLCIILILIGGLHIFSKLTAKETIRELNTYSKAGQIVEEVFSSIRTVLSLNGQKFEQNRYEKELNATRWSSVRKGAALGLFTGWLSLMIYIIYFVGFIVGSHLINFKGCNQQNVSDILVIVVIIANSIIVMTNLSPCFQSLTEARSAAVQIFDLIDEEEVANVNDKDVLKENMFDRKSSNIDGDIEFVNVSFSYPTRKDILVLKNINLIARAGQTIALVGQSGSGKSTCISLLLRYYEACSGGIRINGRPITEYNIKQFRESIGVVNQEPILFNTSIYENICYGQEDCTRDEIEEAARQANAHNFIMELPNKYDTFVGERGVQLSGGEKQRVALARALLKNPTILLLDEATSALDNQNEKLFQEALNRACQNRITIVIAHRLSTIKNAHHIYVLNDGCIVEHGTRQTLVDKDEGIYKQMINMQQIEIIDDDTDQIDHEHAVESEDKNNIYDYSDLLRDTQCTHTDKSQFSSSNGQTSFIRLLSMNRPEWLSILIGCLMSTLAGISQMIMYLLIPETTTILLINCIYGYQIRNITKASCLFLIIGVAVLFIRFFQYTAFAISGSNLTERIRAKAFAALLRQEVAYFDQPENSSSAISTRLSSDAHNVQKMTGPRLGIICETSVMVVLAVIFAFVLNYQLALILLGFFTIIISITFLDIHMNARVQQRVAIVLQQASTIAGDVLNNMRTIKHLTAEKKVLRQYCELIDQSLIIQRIPLILSSLVYGLVFSTYPYCMVAIYWCTLHLVQHNEFNPNRIIMIFPFVPFLIRLTQMFWIIIADGSTLISGAQYFFNLLDRISTIDNGSTEGEELHNFGGNIDFDHVSFKYASRSTCPPILTNFHLSIKQGQRVALIGASGCGKSTTIQLLERFYDVTHGHVRFDGVDIRQLNIHWLRSCIGLVCQEPILFDMTIAENIGYARDNVQLEDIIDAAKKANIHEFIYGLPQGYETPVGPKGYQLSGGEKQRVAIARALIRRPKVLLLDEATSAMDSHNEQMIQQTLEEIYKEAFSQTMLIVAHRLSTIRSCDLICVLQNGRIIESGTHTDLVQRRGFYYRMLLRHHL